MKVIMGLIAVVATISAVSQADAATYRRAKRGHVQEHRAYAPSVARVRDDDDSPTGYYEHRLEAVRFGSKRWWSIFDERSGGSQHR